MRHPGRKTEPDAGLGPVQMKALPGIPFLRRILLPVLSGVCYFLSFPSYNLWPLAWVFAVPLLISVEGSSPGRAFLSGMIAGLVAWAGVVYWIALVMSTYGGMGMPMAVFLLLLLMTYLALYFGVFAWAASRLAGHGHAFLVLPGIWAALELFRSSLVFSGFPWALLGHSQLPFTALAQTAELGGVILISAVVMTGNVALYQAMRKRYAPAAFALVLAVSCAAFGLWRLNTDPFDGVPLKAAAVQANVPQDQKWDPEQAEATLTTYLTLSKQALDGGADLVVWPETACTFYLFRHWEPTLKVLKMSMETTADLLVGSPARENGMSFNRAYLLRGGRIAGYYDKVHLVPFGEYLPLADVLRDHFSGLTAEVGNFTAGVDVEPIEDVAVLICFESIFPDISRRLVSRGARLIVNMSNDAWFKTWSTPGQHLQFACFRAIETRRYLVRAVNHGISAIIDPYGNVMEQIGLLREGMIVQPIARIDSMSLYVRFGPVVPLIWAILSVIAALTMVKPGAKAKGR